MRLIDADALIEALLEARHEETETTPKLVRFIRKQPTIEPDKIVYDYLTKNNITEIHNHRTGQIFRPVRHGRWIADEHKPLKEMCSVCGFAQFQSRIKNFCPNCGAIMEREGK